ncbi:hypothetical protein NQ317_003800, partial [Molorchus minor]
MVFKQKFSKNGNSGLKGLTTMQIHEMWYLGYYIATAIIIYEVANGENKAIESVAVNDKKLTKKYFHTLISSRKDYVKFKSFNTLDEMEKYAERTVSNVLRMWSKKCYADHTASHLGKAQGIVQQLSITKLTAITDYRVLGYVSVPVLISSFGYP